MGFPGIPDAVLEELAGPGAAQRRILEEAVAACPRADAGAAERLLHYGRLLLAGNTVASLTGARDWDALIGDHLADCARAAGAVPVDAGVIADWGSGAGLPGLAWACLWPQRTLHLCERTTKKAAFLREAAARLDLPRVQVHGRPGEEAWRALRPRPLLVVARAVEPLPRLLPRLQRCLSPGLPVLVMAGPRWETAWQEAAAAAPGWSLAALDEYALAGDRGARVVLHLVHGAEAGAP